MSDLSYKIADGRHDAASDLLAVQWAVLDAGADIEAAMAAVAQGALTVFPLATGAIVQIRRGDELHIGAASGAGVSDLPARVGLQGGLAAPAIRARRPFLCREAEQDPAVDRLACLRLGIRSLVAIPLIHLGDVAGALILTSDIPDGFTDDDARAAQLLAGSLGVSIGNARSAIAPAAPADVGGRFEATFAHAPVGMAHVAPDGHFLLVNEQFCAIAGHTRETLLEHGFQRITHPDDLTSDLTHVRQLLAGKADRYSMEKRYIRSDGGVVWINLTVSLIRDGAGVPDFFVAVIEDVSEIKRAQAEALLDPLTGLLNRRGLIERLSQEIERAADKRAALSLIYLDLDDFKAVNDTYGHAAGDACLLEVAEALAESARLESGAARIGGDEFILLLPRTDAGQLAHVMERLQLAIGLAGKAHPWSVSASLGGLTLIPQSAVSPQTLIERADEAMFRAKRSGKGRSYIAAA
jgi:diguanylate cyclase (GGDEF)-like protein/PAS domain S-box-containing protein